MRRFVGKIAYWSEYIGASVAAYALFALIVGWWMQVDEFVRIVEGKPAMVPTTAFCFILLGTAIMTSRMSSAFDTIMFSVSGLWLGALCGLELIWRLSDGHFELERLFGFDLRAHDAMAAGTILGLFALASSMLAIVLGRGLIRYFAYAVVAFSWVFLLILLVLIWCGIKFEPLYWLYAEMSYPTIILMFLSNTAVFGFALRR